MSVSPPILVLVHGLLSTPKEFGLIGHALRLGGLEVVPLHIEGFTDASREGVSTWEDWIASALEAFDSLTPGGRPVILGGLCVGGVIAAELALRRKDRVGGLVMMSPTFEYDGWGVSWWYRLRHIAYALGLDRFIRIAEREPYGIRNERIRRWVVEELETQRQSAIGPARLPLWAIHEAEKLMAHVRSRLPRLHPRTLIIHSRCDELSSLPGVEAILSEIGSLEKSLVVLENSYHMITIDNDRTEVVRELIRFSGAGRERAGTPPPRPASRDSLSLTP